MPMFSANCDPVEGQLWNSGVVLLYCEFSSGVIWERKKRKRYKSLTVLQSQMLEEGYQRYQNDIELAHGQRINGRRVLSDGKLEVQ